MTALIWFNEDSINPDHEMIKDYADAPRLYIFDLPYLQEWNISKHRIQFIYESLLEVSDVQIYKGETVPILRQLAEQHQAREIVTSETPNHIIRSHQREVSKFAKLVVYDEIYPGKEAAVSRRFSRYWNKHDREWMAR